MGEGMEAKMGGFEELYLFGTPMMRISVMMISSHVLSIVIVISDPRQLAQLIPKAPEPKSTWSERRSSGDDAGPSSEPGDGKKSGAHSLCAVVLCALEGRWEMTWVAAVCWVCGTVLSVLGVRHCAGCAALC